MYQNPQFAKCDVLNSLINFENLRLLDISSWQEIYEDDLSALDSCRIGHVFPNEGCDHISEMVPTKMFKKALI
eukprot:Awhi_evm2s2457